MTKNGNAKRYARKFAIQKQIEAETNVLTFPSNETNSLVLTNNNSAPAPATSNDIQTQLAQFRAIFLGENPELEEERREILTSMCFELWAAGKPGVQRGSSDHIEAELKVIKTIAEINGLMKPQRQRLDVVQTEVKIDWGGTANIDNLPLDKNSSE